MICKKELAKHKIQSVVITLNQKSWTREAVSASCRQTRRFYGAPELPERPRRALCTDCVLMIIFYLLVGKFNVYICMGNKKEFWTLQLVNNW